MLMNCLQYRSHATTAGGVKTYLLNRQLFDIKIRNVVIRNFLCVLDCSFGLVLLKLRQFPSHVHVLLKLKHLSKASDQDASQVHMSSSLGTVGNLIN